MNSGLQERLTEAFRKIGSQRDVAKSLGVSVGRINSYARGLTAPDVVFIERVAGAAGIPAVQLAFGANVGRVSLPSLVEVPQIDVKASAGHGELVIYEDVKHRLAFNKTWLRQFVQNVDAVRVLEADGISMLRRDKSGIAHSDLLMVDTSVTWAVDGLIYVFRYYDRLFVKRLIRKVDGSVIVRSDNEDFEDDIVPADQAHEIDVRGLVFWHGGEAR